MSAFLPSSTSPYSTQMLDFTTQYLLGQSPSPPPPHPLLPETQWHAAWSKSPQGLSVAGKGCKRNDVVAPTSACVVYIGLSHMPARVATDENSGSYDVDFVDRGGFTNHNKMVRESLSTMGITNVHHVMCTNSNSRHAYFCELLSADPSYIDNVTPADEQGWIDAWKSGTMGAGNGLPAGHRLKKIVDNKPLPEADIYIFIRCDITLKIPLHEMNLDLDKINWGWIEQRGPSLAMGDHFSGFKTGGRVAGSGLHICPKRLLNVFVDAYSHDHNSLHYLLKQHKLSLLSDVHFIAGIDRAYSSSSDIMDNPLYIILRGPKWPSPNLKLRLAGVVAHVADHASRGADLTQPPYSILVQAIDRANEVENSKGAGKLS